MGISVRFIPRKEALEKLEKSYPEFRSYYIEAIQALFLLSSDLEKSMEHHFSSRCEFTRGRFLVLMVLLHSENNELSPHEIAKVLGVTRGNMTSVIEGLLKGKLVTKREDLTDRRLVWIKLAPAGKKLLEKIFPDYFRRMSRFMSVLTRAEVETFIGIARKLHAGLGAFSEP